MKTIPLFGLLLLARLFGQPLAAQDPAARVAAQTAYLADALRLSARQCQRLAPLLRRQLSSPAQPVSPAAWLRVLTLQQYQAWQHFSGSAPGGQLAGLPAPPSVLLAGGPCY